LLALFLLCEPPSLLAQEGKLQKIRDEASRESPSSGGDDSKGYSCDSDDTLTELCAYAAFYCVAVPYVLTAKFLGDDYSSKAYFLPYPYAGGKPGSMQLHFGEEEEPCGKEDPVKWWLARLAVEESSDFHNLNRVNGHLLLDTCFRLGLQTSWSYLTENLNGDKHDHMVLGDVNLVFRFAQNDYVQVRSGLGIRLSTDSHECHAGFNFTYGADIYPIKPWVFSALIDAGTLGSAGVFHGRVTAGVQWRRCEFYAGYDYLLIGSVDLQGPVAGLRVWF
jgi:hypothetical protein